MNDIRAALATHRFLHGVVPRVVDALVPMAAPVEYSAGSWIARAGGDADRFLLVTSGRAGVEITAAGRAPLVVATVHPGEVIGWSWFTEPHVWHFDVVALDDVHAVSLDAAELRTACAVHHELGYEIATRLLRVVSSRLEATRHQLVDVYGRARD